MRAAVWVGAVAVLATGGTALGQERKPDILAKLEGHRGGVAVLEFSPNPSQALALLATGTGNGVVRLWDAHTGKFLVSLDAPKHNGAGINNVGFSASGFLLSSSSRNGLVVWNFFNPPPGAPPGPPPDKKDFPFPKDGKKDFPFPKDGKKDEGQPRKDRQPPRLDQHVRPDADFRIVFEDTLGADPVKIGTVTGDGQRIYYAGTEGARITVNSHVFDSQFGSDTGDELNSSFTPWAMAAIPDRQSGLIAMYGSHKEDGKTQPAIGLVGLGAGRVIGRGVVRTPVVGRPISINFAPDRKWLVACNGEDVMYWRVPGSQVVTGDPKFLANSPAYVAAAGSGNRIAFASPPEEGKTVRVTIVDISRSQPKTIAVYTTDIEKVSVLRFSSDGGMLAVADDVEGIVQLWELEKPKKD